jgi:hypothetical protein
MSEVVDLIASGVKFPMEYILALIALAAIALAGFAIHAVHSIAKKKDE